MAVQTLEIGDEEAPSRPKRLTPKDFILYESTENSSGRCAGLIVIFIVVIFSDILFATRQHIYLKASEFNEVQAFQSVVNKLGLAVTDDADECSVAELTLQYKKKTDEINCGTNSLNAQGCRAGFYQPSALDPIGPGVPCPDGYWCPADFICKVACPFGSLCLQTSRASQDSYSCDAPFNIGKDGTISLMYNESLTCASSVPPYKEKCPGASQVPLCPARKYCPSSTELLDCPVGHYCPDGTFEPIKCFRGDLTCPRGNLGYPFVFIPIGILMLTTFLLITCIYVFSIRSVVKNRNARRLQQAIEVKNRKENRVQQFIKHHYGEEEGDNEYDKDNEYDFQEEDKSEESKEVSSRNGDAMRDGRESNAARSNASSVKFAPTSVGGSITSGSISNEFLTTTTTSINSDQKSNIWKKTFDNVSRTRKASFESQDNNVVFSTVNNTFRLSQSTSPQSRYSETSSYRDSYQSTLPPPPPPVAAPRKIGKKITVWLFLGADLDTHKALLVLSTIGFIVGAVLGFLYPTRAPVFGIWINIGIYTMYSTGPILLASLLGCFFLNVYKSAWTLVQDDSRRKIRMTVSEESFSARTSSSSPGGRIASMDQRKANTAFLGSLKEKIDTRVNLEVDKLGLKLNTDKRVVLAGVDGKFEAGSVTAIMGPSGAGKTTFMNALSGRANYGTTTGRILINGEENSIMSISRVIGFVPQEDIMHRELTVREILKSYAFLRLPRYYDAMMIERVVQDVVEALKLDNVSDSIIGDETKRGISGGQRKRVNVGMEMVADPSLLFLDEPTSGLDSTTSFDLVSALKSLAVKGVNVIAVLHQPSCELYNLFTKVLLLGKGGHTVFLGKSSDALKYFNHIGYSSKKINNPADFFMDVIAGKVPKQTQQDERETSQSASTSPSSSGDFRNKLKQGNSSFKDSDLFALWVKHRVAYENEELLRHSRASRFTFSEEKNKQLNRVLKPVSTTAYAMLEPAGFGRALLVNVKRCLTQHIRGMSNNIYDILLHCGTGGFLGLANEEVTLPMLGQALSMYSLGLGMTIGLASLRVFGNERVIFWREAADGSGMGLNPFPYFIAKNLTEIPRILVLTFCLAGCFYPYVKVLCGFDLFFGMSFMAAWHISGWSFLLSITFDEKSAQLMLVIICLVHLLYAGIQTHFSDMGEMGYGLSWLSPNRWLIEDLFICHTSQLSAVYRLPPTWYTSSSNSLLGYISALTYTDRQGDTSTKPYWNILMNFWFGLLLRVLSFISLCYSNRDQMAKPPLSLAILRTFNTQFKTYVASNIDLEEVLFVQIWKGYTQLMKRLNDGFFSESVDEVDNSIHQYTKRFSTMTSFLPKGKQSKQQQEGGEKGSITQEEVSDFQSYDDGSPGANYEDSSTSYFNSEQENGLTDV